jgi:hypothetical protein
VFGPEARVANKQLIDEDCLSHFLPKEIKNGEFRRLLSALTTNASSANASQAFLGYFLGLLPRSNSHSYEVARNPNIVRQCKNSLEMSAITDANIDK